MPKPALPQPRKVQIGVGGSTNGQSGSTQGIGDVSGAGAGAGAQR